jgi:hypothetical protein
VREHLDRESIGTATAGAVLGGLVGSIWGSPRFGVVLGGLHGWSAGRRRIYEWRHRRGVAAFLLDHTWALPTTIGGTVAMRAADLRRLITGIDAGFEDSLSRRRNRFVFRRGFVLRRGFALTVGTVITGAADAQGEITERRRRLVDDHEDVHVWQARLLGPLYPALYASWFAAGVLFALARRVARRSTDSLTDDIDTFAYYRNPFEWHAYTCDHNWPPAGVDPTAVWTKKFPVSAWVPRALRDSESPQETE